MTHILTSIPPDGLGDVLLDLHRREMAAMPDLRWIGYLGTTAVYGDRGGEWVDEESPTRPTLDRACRREQAERAWLESGLPVHIFRLAGIYGPGRNPLVNLRNGSARRIVKPGQTFSRIHVEDIVRVLLASIEQPNPPRIYNVCDEEPAPPQDVVAHAAKLLGVEPPPEQPYETAELSPMARTFYADNRKVSATRIRDELGVHLLYPTYREGLASLVREEG
ncbi:MAG: SDR family oxidoreductase [Geminicoccaceae bacterium]